MKLELDSDFTSPDFEIRRLSSTESQQHKAAVRTESRFTAPILADKWTHTQFRGHRSLFIMD